MDFVLQRKHVAGKGEYLYCPAVHTLMGYQELKRPVHGLLLEDYTDAGRCHHYQLDGVVG
jgi:hypothetical protein